MWLLIISFYLLSLVHAYLPLGARCKITSCGEGMICDQKLEKCVCKDDHYISYNQDVCQQRKDTCNKNEMCIGPNVFCHKSTGMCRCNRGYSFSNGYCSANVFFKTTVSLNGGNCASNYNCAGNLICDNKTWTCTCKKHMEFLSQESCQFKENYCDDQNRCKSSNTECNLDSSSCECVEGFTRDLNDNNMTCGKSTNTSIIIAIVVTIIVFIAITVLVILLIKTKRIRLDRFRSIKNRHEMDLT